MSSREKWVNSGDAVLWSTVSGSGDPVILINGGPGCDDYLEPVAQLLLEHAEVVRYEPRGCGRSTFDGQYDLATAVADIDNVRDAYNFERVLLIGHSFGPDLALAYALTFPGRVIGLIGIAGGRLVNDRSWSAIYHEKRETVGEDHGGKKFTADPRVNPMLNESWKVFCRQPELLKKVAKLDVPAWYISAGMDIRPNWPTEQLASLLPKGEYREIAGASHFIWLTHAKALQGILLEAMRRIRE